DSVSTMTHYVFTHDKRQWDVPVRFFRAEETQALVTLYAALHYADTHEWSVTSKQKTVSSEEDGVSVFRMSDVLIGMAKSLMTVQRYKGLGEMNPEQLWETTLNPDTRRLSPVVLGEAGDDPVRECFHLLMGKGESSARRQWLERRGHEVEVDI
ncbi:MAG: hypothetical protein EBZ43_10300, partial [Betaproteobacteria bacterium]|nr:hypothetical protein [Betaproteobacteria bacterium]